MFPVKDISESILHLLFPHVCSGCGSDLLSEESNLCLHCLSSLPKTDFHLYPNNLIEKKFWGRIPLVAATAQYYFTKGSLVQNLMHEFKYKGDKALGRQLGRLMGKDLLASARFNVDALIPLPLFAARAKRRGYNQAEILCEGIADIMNVEVLTHAILRTKHTETQTKKARIERWQNIEGKFELVDKNKIANKRVLVVDDIVTTGATLEACGHELLTADNLQLSVATFSYANR